MDLHLLLKAIRDISDTFQNPVIFTIGDSKSAEIGTDKEPRPNLIISSTVNDLLTDLHRAPVPDLPPSSINMIIVLIDSMDVGDFLNQAQKIIPAGTLHSIRLAIVFSISDVSINPVGLLVDLIQTGFARSPEHGWFLDDDHLLISFAHVDNRTLTLEYEAEWWRLVQLNHRRRQLLSSYISEAAFTGLLHQEGLRIERVTRESIASEYSRLQQEFATLYDHDQNVVSAFTNLEGEYRKLIERIKELEMEISRLENYIRDKEGY